MGAGVIKTDVPANTTGNILNTDKADSLNISKPDNVEGNNKKEDTAKNKVIATTVKKGNDHFKPYWIISAGFGPDVSAVELNNTGKITLQYGTTVRLCCFSKIYSAYRFFCFEKNILRWRQVTTMTRVLIITTTCKP